jgi:hypothetical protein
MASTVTFVVDTQAPLLDHVGVELARRQHAARQQLASQHPSVTYEMLAAARGQTEPAARQWVRRMREAGKLVTVEYGNTLIPSFQFDSHYDLVPAVSDTVHLLTDSGMSGWAVWRWFCTTSPWIDQPPTQLVERGRLSELEALVQRFIASSHGG